MNIVRIVISGYGCEINRGVLLEGDQKNIENFLYDSWVNDLFKKLEEKTKIEKLVSVVGLISGDVLISVNGELIINTSINSLDSIIKNTVKKIDYDKKEGVLITSLQHKEGVFSDTVFVLDDNFDLNRLSIVKNDLTDEQNIVNPSLLYSEMYYEDEPIQIVSTSTDLRMSRLYLENLKTI